MLIDTSQLSFSVGVVHELELQSKRRTPRTVSISIMPPKAAPSAVETKAALKQRTLEKREFSVLAEVVECWQLLCHLHKPTHSHIHDVHYVGG